MLIESDFIKVELKNGIVEATYKPVFITLNIAKEVLRTRHEITLGKIYPMLLNGIGIKGIDKEARDFFFLARR